MIYLRSFLYFLGQLITAVFFSLGALFLLPFSFQVRYAFTRNWARFNIMTLKLLCGLDYQVTGQDNIPQKASVIMCKHQSAWETIALQEVFPPQIWVLKRNLLWIPFFGWGLWALNPIAIDRAAGRRAVQQVVEQGKDRLQKGRWVVVFPEGTRIPAGMKGRYKQGGAILAVEAGRAVVPVAHNAGEFWPRHSFLKYPGTIQLVIGPVIETEGKTAEQVCKEAEQWIEATMPGISSKGYSGEIFRR
jgi:1-acyl-sn-glycerol-3-phosphate acyltransferase